jgi:hypothetical protein
VVVIAFDVAGVPVTQEARLEVITTVITSLLANEVVE